MGFAVEPALSRRRTMKRLVIAGITSLITATAFPALAQKGVVEGTVARAGGGANLVVFIAEAPGAFPASKEHVVMDQKKMTFVPHVLPVLVGSTVDFVNSDSVGHNVFSPDNEGYNLGTWPKGDRRSYTYKKTGVYTQLCSIHPEMEAFILVLQNPYFATTKADGHFTIPNLPPGHYALKVWGEKLKKADKARTFPVDVVGAKTTIAISL
jgi:plastocyanin